MTDDAHTKALEQENAAMASMLIELSGAAAAAPIRFRCLGVDSVPQMTGRDPARGYPIAIFVGPGLEPDAIRAGAKLRAAADSKAG